MTQRPPLNTHLAPPLNEKSWVRVRGKRWAEEMFVFSAYLW